MNFTGSSIEYMMQQNRAAMEKRGSSRDALPLPIPAMGVPMQRKDAVSGTV